MKKIFLFVAFLFLVFSLFLSCMQQERPGDASSASPAGKPARDSLVRKGAYLVSIMGCSDCHSPKIMSPHGPMPDTSRLLSGYPADMPLGHIDTTTLRSWVLFTMTEQAAVGPWGVSFAANLTSDQTGIGGWSLDQFKKAMREGKYMGLDSTRMLLPPMPWQSYIHLSDEDAEAIFDYLQSTRPIKNLVPQAMPPVAMSGPRRH